jgi:peptidoglycan/xylan/chitin deacetylase (PgdA/CDA1 family)
MRVLIASAATLFLFAAGVLTHTSQPAARPGFPGQRQAAVALTYDDALGSQLEVAIPQLDAAGLKGTFFLTGREVRQNVPRWRAVAAKGHELANHTVNHPCARGTYDMPAQYTSEAYSVQVLLTEITVMNGFLQAMDGKSAHSLATPCEQNLAGGEDYLGPAQKARAASYIRDHRTMPSSIVYTSFVNTSGADMIKWVGTVQAAGAAGVVVFHGVGGDYLNVSGDAHQQLLAYLKAHDREIWTATFSEIMESATRAASSPSGR